jgi:hypothetical protein
VSTTQSCVDGQCQVVTNRPNRSGSPSLASGFPEESTGLVGLLQTTDDDRALPFQALCPFEIARLMTIYPLSSSLSAFQKAALK